MLEWIGNMLTSSTFWTAVAAIVSALALVFIARQTGATRKAAQATRDAALAAQATLAATQRQADIAAQSLETSQKAVRQSQQLVEEAIKARIDAQMPRLRVDAPTSVSWPPLQPSDHGDPQPFQTGEEFYLPGDENRRIIVRTPIILANESDYTVAVSIHGPHGGLYRDHTGTIREALATDLRLKPGQVWSDVYFDVERTAGGWADAYRERADKRDGGPSFSLWVRYQSTNDTGAVDSYEILVQGTVFEPVSGKTNAWRVMDTPKGSPFFPSDGVSAIVAEARPMTRTYYLSLKKNIRLDSQSPTDG